MNVLTQPIAHRLLELACRAPSVHNTQPWRWRINSDDSIELWADRDRQLTVADPDGRNLAISCGAALHHLVVAARAMGMTPEVRLTPSPDDPDLLAHIRVAAGAPSRGAEEVLDAIERRCTDRRRFTSWPVPDSRLTHLAQTAVGWGAYAIPIVDASSRFRCELLLTRARAAQQADQRFAEEQQAWTGHSAVDGVPLSHGTSRSGGSATYRNNRFAPEGTGADSAALLESSDGLMAICTALDDQRAWLASGEALSALWLRATRDGLSLVPLSQVVEVAETRSALHHDTFAGMAHAQLLLRIGWQEIGRADLTRTPRRPVDDVLLLP